MMPCKIQRQSMNVLLMMPSCTPCEVKLCKGDASTVLCRFPKSSMPPKVVQRIIKDSRELDATPRLNLASFVTTWSAPHLWKTTFQTCL